MGARNAHRKHDDDIGVQHADEPEIGSVPLSVVSERSGGELVDLGEEPEKLHDHARERGDDGQELPVRDPGGRLEILIVPPALCPAVVDRIRPALQASCDEGHGYFTVEGILRRLVAGQWTLWVAVDERNKVHAACCLVIEKQDDGEQAMLVTIATGEGPAIMNLALDEMEAWARRFGCRYGRIMGRWGWERKFRPRGYVGRQSGVMWEF